MKKGFINFIIIIALFLCFSIDTKALTATLSSNKTKLKAGEDIILTLSLSDVPSEGLGAFQFHINYNKELFEYKSINVNCNQCYSITNNNYGFAFIDLTYGTTGVATPFKGGTIGTITLTAKPFENEQTTSFGFSKSVTSLSSGDSISSSNVESSVKLYIPSSNNNLKSLSLSGITLTPAFDKNVTKYTATTDNSSTLLSAETEHSGATITGTGNKTIKYGTNNYDVVVTSETGQKKTYTITITREDKRSNDSKLRSLTLSSGSIDFKPDTYSYDILLEGSVNSLNLSAIANDSKSQISYSPGQKVNLNYGKTVISIIVTAENGSKTIYKVNATRKDDRSSNNKLKTLSTDKGNINFKNTQSTYVVNVENDVTSINISATPEDSKSKVTGTGNKTLVVGSNKIDIKVTAENGSVKVYTITVVRKPSDSDNIELSSINTLESLLLNNKDIGFKKNVNTYKIIVESDVEKAEISYKLTNEKASVTIDGDTNLKVGTNEININVIAEDGTSNTYKLIINKKEFRLEVANEKEEIIEKLSDENNYNDLYVIVNENDEKEIPNSVIEKLKETQKTIIYEVVDSDKELIYSIALNGALLGDERRLSYNLSYFSDEPDILKKLVKNTDYILLNFDTDIKLSNPTKVKVKVSDKLDGNFKTLFLYHFDKNQKKLIKVDTLDVKDGYVDMIIDDMDEYVLSIKEIKSLNTNIIIIISAIILVIIITLLAIILKKKKSKNKKEKIETLTF